MTVVNLISIYLVSTARFNATAAQGVADAALVAGDPGPPNHQPHLCHPSSAPQPRGRPPRPLFHLAPGNN